jgi:hypothetical protein
MTGSEIAETLAAMDKIEIFDMTDEERAAADAGEKKVNDYTIANLNRGIEDVLPYRRTHHPGSPRQQSRLREARHSIPSPGRPTGPCVCMHARRVEPHHCRRSAGRLHGKALFIDEAHHTSADGLRKS